MKKLPIFDKEFELYSYTNKHNITFSISYTKFDDDYSITIITDDIHYELDRQDFILLFGNNLDNISQKELKETIHYLKIIDNLEMI